MNKYDKKVNKSFIKVNKNTPNLHEENIKIQNAKCILSKP